MIIEELKTIVSQSQNQNKSGLYIKSLLKEYLQIYVLNFIYLSPIYSKIFIFTGGTCLRHCFGLNRLSEDLDFDIKKSIDVLEFKSELEKYFKKEYLYDDLQISILQQGKQILLKFPVLKTLGLATNSESDLLYVKIDLPLIISKDYKTSTTLINKNNFNYLVTHYDLPSLMASKIVTILTRNRLFGKENIKMIKGRDYFDLLWFLKNKTLPNLQRINSLMQTNYSIDEIFKLIDKQVENATTISKQYFKQDLLPFIDNPQILTKYIESYRENYDMYKKELND